MTCADLIRLLNLVPHEFRNRPVMFRDGFAFIDVRVVTVDPCASDPDDFPTVTLSADIDAQQLASCVYMDIVPGTPRPTAPRCHHCGGKGWFLTKVDDDGRFLKRCAHCNADGHVPEPDFDNE